ncbi:MAG: DUF2680 domain-containing protein [Chitinophagales bacterium]
MKRLIVAGLLALLLIGAVGGAILAENQTTAQTTAPAAAAAAKARPQPTDKQKAELTDLHNQMLALREKMIDKYLEYRWITKEQANYLKDRIALQKKYAGQIGSLPGFGGWPGRMGRRGGRRAFGMGPGAGMMGPGAGMMGW